MSKLRLRFLAWRYDICVIHLAVMRPDRHGGSLAVTVQVQPGDDVIAKASA